MREIDGEVRQAERERLPENICNFLKHAMSCQLQNVIWHQALSMISSTDL